MSKTAYLVKNTGILTIGTFSSKLLTFFLVPLYTAVLTTSEYGSFDLINTSVALLLPILTLNIADAILRFPLEDGADVPRIARIGITLTLISGVVVLIAQLIPNAPWRELAGSQFIAAMYISNALYQLLLLLARGVERMVDVAVAGVICTAVMVILNIILLLVFNWGLSGFFIANIVGMSVPVVFLVFRLRDVIFKPASSKGNELLRKMVKYSLPLAMTVIGWWFINASGRYIVTLFCGIDANGLYSISYKIPSILNAVAQIFIQAWQVSAIKEFDAEDKDGFLARTFDTIEMLLVLLGSALILMTPLIAMVLFSGDFYEAWRFAPFLIVVVILNTMGGMWGPFFSANYDTAPMATSTVLGGIANVAAGLLLVMVFGVWGVVAANIVAGFTNWVYRGLKVRKHIAVDFHMGRSAVLYIVLVIQGCILCNDLLPMGWNALLTIAMLIGLIWFFRKNLKEGGHMVKEFLNAKRRG